VQRCENSSLLLRQSFSGRFYDHPRARVPLVIIIIIIYTYIGTHTEIRWRTRSRRLRKLAQFRVCGRRSEGDAYYSGGGPRKLRGRSFYDSARRLCPYMGERRRRRLRARTSTENPTLCGLKPRSRALVSSLGREKNNNNNETSFSI